MRYIVATSVTGGLLALFISLPAYAGGEGEVEFTAIEPPLVVPVEEPEYHPPAPVHKYSSTNWVIPGQVAYVWVNGVYIPDPDCGGSENQSLALHVAGTTGGYGVSMYGSDIQTGTFRTH